MSILKESEILTRPYLVNYLKNFFIAYRSVFTVCFLLPYIFYANKIRTVNKMLKNTIETHKLPCYTINKN